MKPLWVDINDPRVFVKDITPEMEVAIFNLCEDIVCLKEQVEQTKYSVEFYKRRCELLQQFQSRMRDPERTIVCDILANAATLPDPDGKRYGHE